jgi:hypothetical protein
VRLMPAQYVKPYVKTNKNDFIDAEAMAEAVGRPSMRFVPIKTEEHVAGCWSVASPGPKEEAISKPRCQRFWKARQGNSPAYCDCCWVS